jgi:hypothetical protein
MRRKILAAVGVVGTVLLGTVVLGGCEEKYVYRSGPYVPQTVTLVNTSTGERVWSYDVPVGQELTMHFVHGPDRATELGYDEMTWTVGPAGQSMSPPVKSRMKVPPPNSRRVDVTTRPGPEMPSGELAHPATATSSTK